MFSLRIVGSSKQSKEPESEHCRKVINVAMIPLTFWLTVELLNQVLHRMNHVIKILAYSLKMSSNLLYKGLSELA